MNSAAAIEAELFEIAAFLAEQEYHAKPRGLLFTAELERDLRRRLVHVIIPERPRLH